MKLFKVDKLLISHSYSKSPPENLLGKEINAISFVAFSKILHTLIGDSFVLTPFEQANIIYINEVGIPHRRNTGHMTLKIKISN